MDEQTKKKWRRWALVAGAVLALVCQSLPHEYQGPCHTIVQICSGGL